MGKIIQLFRDQAILDRESLAPVEEASGLDIRIRMQDMPIEEKLRIWTTPNTAYKASLFYTAGPVEIKSSRKKAVSRVRDVRYDLQRR